MANFIQVANKNVLTNLRNHEIGELAYVTDEKKMYVYNGEWEIMESDDSSLSIPLYEMNKMILSELPALNDEEIEKAKAVIREYVSNNADDYYMLLCHELKYFTVFAQDEYCDVDETIENVIFDCLNYVGTVKSVELSKDGGAIEIWVTTPEDDTYVMYLFDYGRGIVPCRI
jgi:hypothetical protein